MKSSLFQYIVHLCGWWTPPVKANNEHSSYSTVITKVGKGIMRKWIAHIFFIFFSLVIYSWWLVMKQCKGRHWLMPWWKEKIVFSLISPYYSVPVAKLWSRGLLMKQGMPDSCLLNKWSSDYFFVYCDQDYCKWERIQGELKS